MRFLSVFRIFSEKEAEKEEKEAARHSSHPDISPPEGKRKHTHHKSRSSCFSGSLRPTEKEQKRKQGQKKKRIKERKERGKRIASP